jgi:multiple sugar transport system ATP-binding protein
MVSARHADQPRGTDEMAEVAYKGATRIYPESASPAVDRLDLVVVDGEFLVLVGPSGSGKSTALRMLAGLEPVDDGRILVGDRDVTTLAPKDRDIAMVFQNYALYPHMTVGQNMGFALKLAGVKRARIAEQVREAAQILDLTALLDRRPRQLSGGQRQRVAMGRAIVRHPQVFLMDEPLSNLDAKLRVQTRTQIADLQRRLGTTTVYVTHDQVEAMTMGDRVAVLRDGSLQQVARPRDMYAAPANVFVAGFIGSPAMNLVEAEVDGTHVRRGPIAVELGAATRTTLEGTGTRQVTLGFRPESLHPAQDGDGFPLVVNVVEELGSDAFVHGTVEAHGERIPIVARHDPRVPPDRGAVLTVRIEPGAVHVFDAVTGNALARAHV